MNFCLTFAADTKTLYGYNFVAHLIIYCFISVVETENAFAVVIFLSENFKNISWTYLKSYIWTVTFPHFWWSLIMTEKRKSLSSPPHYATPVFKIMISDHYLQEQSLFFKNISGCRPAVFLRRGSATTGEFLWNPWNLLEQLFNRIPRHSWNPPPPRLIKGGGRSTFR